MTTHYCFMDIGIKFCILSFDFYHLEVLEGFFKLTTDFLHAIDNGIHIIALFDACFCTLKVIENLQEFANHICGNKGGKLFLLCISAAAEVFKISLQTQQAVLQLFDFGVLRISLRLLFFLHSFFCCLSFSIFSSLLCFLLRFSRGLLFFHICILQGSSSFYLSSLSG